MEGREEGRKKGREGGGKLFTGLDNSWFTIIISVSKK